MNERPIIIKQITNDDVQERIKQRLQEFSNAYHKKLNKKGYPAVFGKDD